MGSPWLPDVVEHIPAGSGTRGSHVVELHCNRSATLRRGLGRRQDRL